MKVKKRVASLLAGIMILSSTQVLGNAQNGLPAGGISPVEVSYSQSNTTENKDISPKAKVTFKPALDNVLRTPSTSDDKIRPEQYIIKLKDSMPNSVEISSTAIKAKAVENLGTDKYTIVLGDEGTLLEPTQFKPGKLYKLWVVPQHFHEDNKGYFTIPVSSQAILPAKYFVTDFNTIMRPVDDEGDRVEVAWEYIPGAQYKVHYLKEKVDDYNKIKLEGEHSDLLTEENIVIKDENGVKKVVYELSNIDPGMEYSAYVSLEGIDDTAFLKDSFDNVANAGIHMTKPKIAHITTTVTLKVFSVGKDYIELNWKLNESLKGKLFKTVINSQTVGTDKWNKIGTIYNFDSKVSDTGKFEYTTPSKDTIYQVIFELQDGTLVETNKFTFRPSALEEQPLKPQVPDPFSNELKLAPGFNQKDYLVKGDDIDISKMLANTFHANKSPLEIQLVWDAQYKKGTTGTLDSDLEYVIWVVDDEAMLADAKLEATERVTAGSSDIIYDKNGKPIGLKKNLLNYMSKAAGKKLLNTNKTYYIKIIARRLTNKSESQATIVAITLDKNGDIFAPPVLAKPPLKVKDGGITKSSVTIEWLEKWHEIRVNNLDAYTPSKEFFVTIWNSVVYLGGTPPIQFKTEKGLTELILKDIKDITKVKDTVGGEAAFNQNYASREVILGSDVKYEVKPLLYDTVLKEVKERNAKDGVVDMTTPSAFTIEKWIVDKESTSEEGWQPVTSLIDVEHDGFSWKTTEMTGLEANTRYILLIRAYRVLDDGTKLNQTFPSYVIATTLSEHESPEADPTVPVLSPDGVTDSSVAVWWNYNQDFDYEIVYSRLEDPNKAKVWPFKISDVPGEANYVSNGSKASVKITGLIPDTTYNVWIRAKQKKGNKISAWSNPVTQKTSEIGVPDVPRGLGPAAYQSILEAGQDFKPVGSDYITVEWLKDINDIEDEKGDQKQEKTYSYIVEFADNPEFLDAIIVNTSKGDGKGAAPAGGDTASGYEIITKNMVRFNNLIANRPYYVKVKTVLTFKDQEGSREIIKESEYTKWVRILTKTSSDEYDGGDNENIVIYPEAIVETYIGDVWTIEIVDTAKIISDILKKKDYFLTIKAEKYDNRYDAAIRRIKMPKAVIDALINQGMELKVITSTGVYEIPAKVLATYINKHSATDIVQFEFKKIIDYKIANLLRPYPETFLKGEQLDIIIRGKTNTTMIKKLDGYMRVKIKLDEAKEYLYKDLFAYTYNFDTGAWVKENYSPDTLKETYISYLTPITGIYSVYQKTNKGSTQTSTFAMNSLSNTYGISGLGIVYLRHAPVNRDQFIHLMLGIAQNKPQIDLTQPVYTEMLSQARAAGFYSGTNTGAINQEQAIAGIVKLYELKNGFKIKPSSVKFKNVSSQYQEAVSKAYAIGLIETINPKQAVTYEMLCDWIIQVTE